MTLHVDVLIGVTFGVLVGLLPALVVAAATVVLARYTEYGVGTIAAVAVALPLAGANAYVLGLASGEPTAAAPRLAVASVVAVALALYANSQGAALADRLPTDRSAATRSDRTLSAAALDDVDGSGELCLSVTGAVEDVDGYPPLGPDLRARIEADSWRLPADLPLSALESRLTARLETEYDLSTASVSVDDRGRISVAAAPPARDLAERLPEDRRAVSVDALLPAGLARGDRVAVSVDGESLAGTVVSASARAGVESDPGGAVAGSDDAETGTAAATGDGGTVGGAGRVTISMPTADARRVLAADGGEVTVRPRETNPAFEAFSHLRRAGKEIRRVVLTDGSRDRIADAAEELEIVGVRRDESGDDPSGKWRFGPDERDFDDGRAAFVVGPAESEALRSIADATGINEDGERT